MLSRIRFVTHTLLVLMVSSLSWAGYYDQSLTSITQYQMTSGMPSTDEVTDEWFETAFKDEIVFETQEVRYRSPVFKDFSIDFSTLLSAENDRDQLSAALKWKGITIGREEGEAKAEFINASTDDLFVQAGTSLPTTCTGSEFDCIEKIMITSNEDAKLEYEMDRIQFAFSWDDGIQSVFGITRYELNAPILLSRKVDPDISSSCFNSCGAGSGGRYTYEDVEAWGSTIDPFGKTTSTSFYYGIDASEYRLYQAANQNLGFHSGIVGSFFILLNNYEVESSGRQEERINELYGTDFEKAEDFSSDLILSFEFNLGYMWIANITSGGSQIFAQTGLRGIWFMSDSLADDANNENTYVIDEFSGSDYNGWYIGVGATF